MYVTSEGLKVKKQGGVSRKESAARGGLHLNRRQVLVAAATGEAKQKGGGGDKDGDAEILPVHTLLLGFAPDEHTLGGRGSI